MAERLCSRCLMREPERRGLCGACRKYEQRNGRPRPAKVIQRHVDRVVEREASRRS